MPKFKVEMSVISLKKSILILICGIACMTGTAFLLNFLLAGPKLGPVYDFISRFRRQPPVAREILIINTGEVVESGDIFSVLMTLTEFEAADLILTARVSGSSSPVTGTEAEIRRHFSDEYLLTENNIRNTFDGIRLGSIPPVQAPYYIERLLELTEQGRDRLLSGLIDKDEDLIRSAAVFGNFVEADSEPRFDWDGKLRRVNPIEIESSVEHPVYLKLKNRFSVSEIELTDDGPVLILKGADEQEWIIPLDRDWNIIAPWRDDSFRMIDLSVIREYEEANRLMRRVLIEADEVGSFFKTQAEYSPLFLEDYAYVLREEMLKEPSAEKKAAWITARSAYFESLDAFLYGPAEMTLVAGYEEVIADEGSLNQEGLAKLITMRNDVIRSFISMREQYVELSRLHAELKSSLASSFCVMGTETHAEYSALLANVMITGSHVRPAHDRYALFWSITAAFLLLLILFRMKPPALFFSGLGFCVLASVVFGWNFVLTAYWIDPVIVFGSTLSGMLVLFILKRAILRRRANRFRTAYGTAVSDDALRQLIRMEQLQPSEVICADAAVIVIKDFNLLGRENREKPQEAGKVQKLFFSEVKKIVFDAGAVIAGYEGDTVVACFGSPLDKSRDPVNKAYGLVKELLNNEKITWRFGIDAGKCSFSWSPETGFSANGRPVVRAKILVSKTARLNARALISDFVRGKTNCYAVKTGALYNDNDVFYELDATTISIA